MTGAPVRQKAFFAAGNDASVWLDGWYTLVALAQGWAAENPDVDFGRAGGKPDPATPARRGLHRTPEDAGRPLAEELGEQVTYFEVRRAGHALLPERPGMVAGLIKAFFAPSGSRDR